MLNKIYNEFDYKNILTEIFKNKDNLNIFFFTDNYCEHFIEFSKNKLSENCIFINIKEIINDGIPKNNVIFHFIFDINFKFHIIKSDNYHFFINNINLEFNKYKYFLIITNSISSDDLYEFSFEFYNFIKSDKKYNIINFDHSSSSLIYNNSKLQDFFIIIEFEKIFNFEIYFDFWEKTETILTITENNGNIIESINMINPFDFFSGITNTKKIDDLKNYLLASIFKLNIFKDLNIFSNFYLKDINFEYKICSNLPLSKFQSFIIYKISKINLSNLLLKLNIIKNKNSILFIDQKLKNYTILKRKKLNLIPIKTFFYNNYSGVPLPTNGFITKGYFDYDSK